MNIRNAILFTLMTAFIAGLNWLLRGLSHAMEWSSFILFGVVTIALMVSGGYAWDWLTGGPRASHRDAAGSDNHDR
jgi:hypothetical protein